MIVNVLRNMIPNCSNCIKIQKMSTRSIHRVMIVGLGNHDLPLTRHSIGMMLADEIRSLLDIRWQRDRQIKGFWAEKTLELPSGGGASKLQIVLLKPKHHMNENGRSVVKAMEHFDVRKDCVYILHDELDKAVGKFTMKSGGSARGHNGVRSVINALHTDEFPRLRIGIDRPTSQNQVVDYVLTKLAPPEMQIFKDKSKDMMHLLFNTVEKSLSLDKNSIHSAISLRNDILKSG